MWNCAVESVCYSIVAEVRAWFPLIKISCIYFLLEFLRKFLNECFYLRGYNGGGSAEPFFVCFLQRKLTPFSRRNSFVIKKTRTYIGEQTPGRQKVQHDFPPCVIIGEIEGHYIKRYSLGKVLTGFIASIPMWFFMFQSCKGAINASRHEHFYQLKNTTKTRPEPIFGGIWS